jgi:hypothetical protein
VTPLDSPPGHVIAINGPSLNDTCRLRETDSLLPAGTDHIRVSNIKLTIELEKFAVAMPVIVPRLLALRSARCQPFPFLARC